jgi:hypothetical protein
MPNLATSFIRKAWPQTLAGALMAAPTYLTLSPYAAGIIFWGLGALGVIGLVVELWTEFRSNEPRNMKPTAARVGIIFGAVILGIAAWYFWPVPVHSSFRTTYDRNSGELGWPLRSAINSAGSPNSQDSGAVELFTDNAFVIWMQNPGIMCAFDLESGKRHVCTTDVFHSGSKEPELWNESYVKSRLKLSKSDRWPQGSLAFAQINNKDWSWIGKKVNQCDLDGRKIFYQEFQKGTIYGIFRVTPVNSDVSTGVTYIMYHDGTWSRVSTGLAADPCIGN